MPSQGLMKGVIFFTYCPGSTAGSCVLPFFFSPDIYRGGF